MTLGLVVLTYVTKIIKKCFNKSTFCLLFCTWIFIWSYFEGRVGSLCVCLSLSIENFFRGFHSNFIADALNFNTLFVKVSHIIDSFVNRSDISVQLFILSPNFLTVFLSTNFSTPCIGIPCGGIHFWQIWCRIPAKSRFAYFVYSHQRGGISSEHWLTDIFYISFTSCIGCGWLNFHLGFGLN